MTKEYSCPKCNGRLIEGDAFCINCGSRINWDLSGGGRSDNAGNVMPDNSNGGAFGKLFLLVLCAVLLCGIAVGGTIYFMKYYRNGDQDTRLVEATTETEYSTIDAEPTTEAITTEEMITECTTEEMPLVEDEEDQEEVQDIDEEKSYEEEAGKEDEYILPMSDVRLVKEKDLDQLSWRELGLAINELYARHGRDFKNWEIKDYFDNHTEWYEVTLPADDNAVVFNKIEEKNRDFMLKYEAKKYGKRYPFKEEKPKSKKKKN